MLPLAFALCSELSTAHWWATVLHPPTHPGRQPEGNKCVRFGLRGKLETSLPKRKKDTHPRFNILYFAEVLKEAETYVSDS